MQKQGAEPARLSLAEGRMGEDGSCKGGLARREGVEAGR